MISEASAQYGVSGADILALVQSFRKFPLLRSFGLVGSQLSDKFSSVICQSVVQAIQDGFIKPGIALDLSYNNITELGCMDLGKMMIAPSAESASPAAALNIACNTFGQAGCVYIGKALGQELT